jgi:hypothetical protein
VVVDSVIESVIGRFEGGGDHWNGPHAGSTLSWHAGGTVATPTVDDEVGGAVVAAGEVDGGAPVVEVDVEVAGAVLASSASRGRCDPPLDHHRPAATEASTTTVGAAATNLLRRRSWPARRCTAARIASRRDSAPLIAAA